ncbi:dynein regulatory complex protein 8 [Glossina fuscipes]|uniref:Dynein regulatory complex protein 8 n=1 Tax=Glossina fuscipes TaxID=7396 RepID=A0A9C6DRR5_9MUSC|nr:dynein regulatory complex protein 8 [Glossina fuscipes]
MEGVSAELEKRISEAFCIFDHVGDKTIDVREVGTVLRFLGCAPTEKEVNDVITQTEMEDSGGEVHLTKFLPYIMHLLIDRRMEPAGPEELLAAFHVIDEENRGYLDPEYFSKLMMEEGEPFTQEEVDEMLAIAIDPLSGQINYEYYLNQLMVIFEKFSSLLILYITFMYALYYNFALFHNLKKKKKFKTKSTTEKTRFMKWQHKQISKKLDKLTSKPDNLDWKLHN